MSRDLDGFNKALQRYVVINRRSLGPLLDNRARRLQFRLRRLFRSLRPTKEKIEQDAERLDFAITRRVVEGKRLTVRQEIAARKRAIGFLGFSFSRRDWKHNQTGHNTTFEQSSRNGHLIGKTLLRTTQGLPHPSAEITSLLAGVIKQNREHGLIDQALREEKRDMERYMARKKEAEARKHLQGVFKTLIPL